MSGHEKNYALSVVRGITTCRGGRVYLYAVHYLGKGRKRKCYLGPEGGYEYVSA